MYLTKRLPRETGREYALRTLKDNIVRLELAPGSMLSENELSAEMGLSRTPVREALVELSKVDIVEIYPQRGSAIALIDYTLVEEARFMRYVLEKAVVELDCQMAEKADLEELEENLRWFALYSQQGDSDRILQMDDEFHHILFRIAEKERIYGLTRNMSIHFDRVRRMSISTGKEPRIREDHRAILDAIARRDPAAAVAAMELHLSRYKIDAQAIREKYPKYFKN